MTNLPLTTKQLVDNLTTILNGLTALKVLKIEIISPDDHVVCSPVNIPFLNCSCRDSFASSLTELDLKLSVEDLPSIMGSTSDRGTQGRSNSEILPNLEILRLTLEQADKSTLGDPLIASPLVFLISGCGRKLHTISLNTGRGLNPSTGLLEHVSKSGIKFPLLSTLRLRQFYRSATTDFTRLLHFLKDHAGSTRHLQFHLTVEDASNLPSGEIFFSHPMFTQIPLPLLEHLEMEFYYFPSDYLPHMVPFLARSPQLRFLAIDSGHERWSSANLSTLVQCLKVPDPASSIQVSRAFNGLTYLELRLEIFRASVLSLIYEGLPCLEILRLHFFTVSPVGYGNIHDVFVPLVSPSSSAGYWKL
ncbi:hypothetical protein CVT24_000760 [Panaeolus cyanescens]|uniref:F-box domain-containing protein n=1 Tax=Panaeolus cyanescens TaxID=181874 RepID=A0A409YCR7_9AGAR|nr:hypothetical protein CVT24_000760 [Panaeolus cyanescens]